MKKFTETGILLIIVSIFAAVYFLPVDSIAFRDSVSQGLALLKWYAREHVILCLIPAFFIAGAISVFVSQDSFIRYFGSTSRRWLSYSIAAISGTVLAVCSCTVLPLFAGIYKKGASIGPATTFLYSGPAINILAIIMTARVLGLELGIARTIGAVGFSILIGLIMSLIYRKEEQNLPALKKPAENADSGKRPASHLDESLYFISMIGILVFANWGQPSGDYGFFNIVSLNKWLITALFSLLLAIMLVKYIGVRISFVIAGIAAVMILNFALPEERQLILLAAIFVLSTALFASGSMAKEWLESSWGYVKQIMPLLAIGVFVSGMLLGTPENPNGLIPNQWIEDIVGGNSLGANVFASVVGALMYFATLTEVPIIQGLLSSGMGKGPALSLLLAGPALSLPSMLVLKSIIGMRKTLVYITLVILMSSAAGVIFGSLF
jgi:hypothetical protein